jgi:hypothetical protein
VKAGSIFVAATALGAVLALPPAPAGAQGAPGVLPPYEIVTILRSTGMTPVGRPVRRGPTYVLRAIDAAGEEVRVVVDARNGQIVSVRSVDSAAFGPPVGTHPGPYGRIPGDVVYVDPDPLFSDRRGTVVEYEERPVYVPEAPPGRYSSLPPRDRSMGEPRVIPAPGGSGDVRSGDVTGALPPPPDRFQRRAPSQPQSPAAARPAQQRTISTVRVSGPPPIPRPRPAAAAPQAPVSDTAPLPPQVPEKWPDTPPVPSGDSVPH